MNERLDLIVIGAGPAGLACAIHARKRKLDFLVLEKGCLVNSIYNYPESMTFFTTAELLEIGEVPFVVHAEKPKRVDALKYYRRVAAEYSLPVLDFQRVVEISGEDMEFHVKAKDRYDEVIGYWSRKLIFATGYYDNPNLLKVPGEEMAKVSHYYNDPHPYYGKTVAVVGGKNSAAIAALELYRNGADVTLVHRRESVGREVKYWIRPDIENRIKNGEIRVFFNTTVKEIRRNELVLATPEGNVIVENDYVFALTGYHPDSSLLRQAGVEVDPDTFIPSHDPESLETNVKGLYLAGSIVSGRMTNRIFIENGRFHGEQIFPHLVESLEKVKTN
jgi:thioredoxin reductase (NADPH)